LQTIYPHDEVGEHRNLQSDEEVCAFIIDELVDGSYAQFCSCDRVGDSYVLDCVYTDCPDCELLQGSEEETCAISNDGVVLSLSEDLDLLADLFYSCTLYQSGLFDSTAVCLIEEFTGEFCAVTVDDEACNSCEYVDCGGGYTDYSVDCSNVIPGEVWNFCTDDIPETSPFISYGYNDLFFFEECSAGTPSPSPGLVA
jgi:hypothetical protein